MKRNKLRILACALAALAALTVIAFTAASGAGSRSDPLVTLSYLSDTFTGQIMDKVSALLTERDARLTEELTGRLAQSAAGSAPAAGSAYTAVTLSAGQTLWGDAGCELLLRSGDAGCAASASPGLVDTTAGGSLDPGGALLQNHLYLMTDSRAVTSASGATLLVRGSYTIG